MKIRDRIKGLRRIPADKLDPHPQNWRVHPEQQRSALSTVLDKVGWADAIVAREIGKGRYQILDGHLRAETAGDEKVPVLVVDLDDQEAQLVLATHDPLAGMADHDVDYLGDLLDSLSGISEDVDELLASISSTYELESSDDPEELEDVEPQIDRAEELREKWGTERGQIWIIEGKQMHRLMCGDATSAEDVAELMDGERCELCFTSPPYNLGSSCRLRSGPASQRDSAYVHYEDNTADWAAMLKASINASLEVSHYTALNLQLLAGNKCDLLRLFGEYADLTADMAVWVKSTWQPAMAEQVMSSAFEFVWILSSDPKPTRRIATASFDRGTFVNVFTSRGSMENDASTHAAGFPLSFASHFISNLTSNGSNVLDPFLGSGTTMLAAEQLNRRCFGMEISPAYCAVILQRMTDAGCKCRLHEGANV